MALQDNYQYRQALELLKIGLEHGTIKLLGTARAVDAMDNGKADAIYVLAFLDHLSSVLPADSSPYA